MISIFCHDLPFWFSKSTCTPLLSYIEWSPCLSKGSRRKYLPISASNVLPKISGWHAILSPSPDRAPSSLATRILKTHFQPSAHLSFQWWRSLSFWKGTMRNISHYSMVISKPTEQEQPGIPALTTAGSSLVGQPGSSWIFLLNIFLHALPSVPPGSAPRRFICVDFP